jgi:hypothetical protein
MSDPPYVQQPNLSAFYEVVGGGLQLLALGIGLLGIGMCGTLLCYVGLALQIPVAVAHCSGFFAAMHALEYGAVLPLLGPILSPPLVWLMNISALVGSFFLASKIHDGGEALERHAREIAERAGFVYPPGYGK